jgi:hypothetical protein
MGRRINDGDMTGLKQDRYRNSRFEFEDNIDQRDPVHFGGVSRKSANTLGGVHQENRGRRYADENLRSQWDNSPFENGNQYNWKNRQGWENFYSVNGNRTHGGAIQDHDIGHRGKGPKGYKRPDESIYSDVCDRLAMSADIDASNIEVSVKEGIVYLRGSVSDRRLKRRTELEIENVSGVTDVQNLLSFKKGNEELH